MRRNYFERALFIAVSLLFSFKSFAQYPDNIFPDTAFAPFYYGVASGDPLQDRVIIWTKVFVRDSSVNSVRLQWQVSPDNAFSKVSGTGEVWASRKHDFTAKADVADLKTGSRYYYRFITTDGKASQIGIAKTLPPDSVKQFKLAVVSCSSVWSGYFNAYRRIAERDDIDFLVHLGDYAYDYPDPNELVRMPAQLQKDVCSLNEWRERHTYYLLDPDLRAARQNKTWIAEWDNHDTNVEAPGTESDAIQSYYEYLPIRVPDTLHPENIYRVFHFGSLAHLIMIDMQLFRGKEECAPGIKSVLGNVQDEWFKKELLQCTATWKLIGNQEMMGSWMSEGAPRFLPIPGDKKYFDTGNWDGFPDDRIRLYDFLLNSHISNFVVMTGDIHMSFIIDLVKNPKDKSNYNRRTGQGAVGVEFTVPSISRGNMDESGVPRGLIPFVQLISKRLNPHHRWCQFSEHGYSTLEVTPERCTVEFWYSKILEKTNKEKQERRIFYVTNDENHWKRR